MEPSFKGVWETRLFLVRPIENFYKEIKWKMLNQ